MTGLEHIPVLRDEVLTALAPADGECFVDCTLGMGGHSEAILEASDCRVIGIDRDEYALKRASSRLKRFADRFVALHGRFSGLASLLASQGVSQVHGILADLGVSSPQLDDAGRGFSFRRSGPVDMRMDQGAPLTAADIVNEWPADDLANCLYEYGEERRSRRVAAAIVAGRPWTDTAALAETVAKAVGGRRQRIHPATRTFQALRIAVNDELGELKRFLPLAVEHLLPGGRLAVISFHSLEDRILKRFLFAESGRVAPRDPYGNPMGEFRLSRPSSRPSPPNDPNPRARSARLRSAVRL